MFNHHRIMIHRVGLQFTFITVNIALHPEPIHQVTSNQLHRDALEKRRLGASVNRNYLIVLV